MLPSSWTLRTKCSTGRSRAEFVVLGKPGDPELLKSIQQIAVLMRENDFILNCENSFYKTKVAILSVNLTEINKTSSPRHW